MQAEPIQAAVPDRARCLNQESLYHSYPRRLDYKKAAAEVLKFEILSRLYRDCVIHQTAVEFAAHSGRGGPSTLAPSGSISLTDVDWLCRGSGISVSHRPTWLKASDVEQSVNPVPSE